MNESEVQALATAWAERYQRQFSTDASGVIQEQNINWPAWEQLHSLTHAQPLDALRVVIAVARSTDNEWVLENLGAGPLEDLIHYHGNAVIEHIEREAKENPSFVDALTCVWESGPEEIWSRVQAVVEQAEHNKPLKGRRGKSHAL